MTEYHGHGLDYFLNKREEEEGTNFSLFWWKLDEDLAKETN